MANRGVCDWSAGRVPKHEYQLALEWMRQIFTKRCLLSLKMDLGYVACEKTFAHKNSQIFLKALSFSSTLE